MRKKIPCSLFVVILMVGTSALQAQVLPTRNSQVEKIVQEISPENIQHIITKLVSFGTRSTISDQTSNTRGIGAVRRWIQGELEKYSRESGGRLQVSLDSFVADPSKLPGRWGNRLPKPTEIVNVVATLPGSDPQAAGRIYVVSGHYDSICSNMLDTRCDAPGADDDGSGTALSMELARVMSKYKFDATLVFLCVAGEEQGLVGSEHWAKMAREKNLDIPAMLDDDIVGGIRGGDGETNNQVVRVFSEGIPSTMTEVQKRILEAVGGENDSPSRQIARYVLETAQKYTPSFQVKLIYRRDRYARGGDHFSFNENGYAAVRFSEYHEDFRHQHQTPRIEDGVQYGDLLQFVSPDYVANVARVNAATLASLALAPAAPTNVHFGTARQSYDTTLQWAPNAEKNLAGYIIVWRDTTAYVWEHSLYVGDVHEFTVHGLSKDNLVFGVRAVDKEGDMSPVTVPLPPLPRAASRAPARQ